MKISKKISALLLSLVLLVGSLGQANAKRLHAAIADWTGGIITCEVAVAILQDELGYKVIDDDIFQIYVDDMDSYWFEEAINDLINAKEDE